jgi:prolyl-tRNA synthetase
MGCTFLDQEGATHPMVMGCYGIGVTRIMAAAIEQNHDERGIVWPMPIAPFQVAILPLQMNVPEVVAAAEKLYAELSDAGFEVLLDDREERAGSKFKDADLIGIPFRLAIGARGLQEGIVELKHRRGGEVVKVAHDGVVAHLRGLVA